MRAHTSSPVRRYIACYALYLLLLALCYGVFEVWRKTTLWLLVAILGTTDSTQALYAAAVVLIVFALFGVAMFGEPYLRDGVGRQELRSRFIVLALPVIGAIAFGVSLQTLILALT